TMTVGTTPLFYRDYGSHWRFRALLRGAKFPARLGRAQRRGAGRDQTPETDMIQDVQKELATALSKSHDALKRELTKLRAGRASANLLDGIKADYYGTPTALTQMAHINVPEPRLLTVKPWDRTQVKAIEK